MNATVHYPRYYNRDNEEYMDETVDIDTLEPADGSLIDLARNPLFWKGMWRAGLGTYHYYVYLDEKSYIVDDRGDRYGFEDFPKLALALRNRETEKLLEEL